MKLNENLKCKEITLIISLILIVLLILLYFLDTSLDWGFEKVKSCIIINLWLFFVPPAMRYGYLYIRDNTIGESLSVGVMIGLLGFPLLFIVAPYFGIKYYLLKSDKK